MSFRGVVIQESLDDSSVLSKELIVNTKIIPITREAKTPWLKQWTLQTVEIPETKIDSFTKIIASAIDRQHPGSWYAEFKNDAQQYVVFSNKVFTYNLGNKSKHTHAIHYGLRLGIPKQQLDF